MLLKHGCHYERLASARDHHVQLMLPLNRESGMGRAKYELDIGFGLFVYFCLIHFFLHIEDEW